MKFGVVGAGVTGLATALELSKNGHSVTIIERDQTPMPETYDAVSYTHLTLPTILRV